MSEYAVVELEEIGETNDGRCPWRPVAAHLGIRAFGANAWTGRAAGDRIINEHHEADDQDPDEELYLVLRGRAAFDLDGERVDAPSGTLVFVRPSVRRTAFAEEPETTIIAVGGVAGKAYEQRAWSIWSPLHPLYEAGRYDEVADRARELLEAHPENAGLFYNVACCESLAGRTTDAIAHLRRSIDLAERFRALARDDADFDPIHDEPAFKRLFGAGALG